jgi:putative membrane protein
MTATQGNLAGLSRYVVRAPRWHTSLTVALVIGAVTGLAVFDSGFLLEDLWQGVFFVGVPTVVASVLTTGIDRQLGGGMTHNRSSLLAVACEIVVVVMLGAAGLLVLLTEFGRNVVFDALLVALASIFAIRLLVVMAVSRHDPWVAAVPAGVQTVAAALLLFVYTGTFRLLSLDGPLLSRPIVKAYATAYLARSDEVSGGLTATVFPSDFALLAALCLLYGVSVVAFLAVLDRPWKRTLGVSMLDFVGGFIGHIAEGSRELEAFFEEIGEDAIVPVTVLAFRRPDGAEKAQFVLPMIHPGPMGEIGGGNLPRRIAEHADGLAFPPHATAGHDFNLVTEREVGTLVDTAESARADVEFTETATESVRVESGDATLLAQAFGEDALLVNTFAPNPADDVEYAVGLSTAAEARSGGFDDVLLVDAHNCNDGLDGEDLGHVVPGSSRSFDMFQAAGEAADRLSKAPTEEMRLGTAWTETDWDPEEGIGPLGVRVAVLTVAGQTTAYVLVDGNNMEPGLRERLLAAVGDRVDRAEVMTSDTHIVNTVESENQVGDKVDQAALVETVSAQVDAALADREPVEAGMASERASVTVFGNDRTETLASQANVAVSLGVPLAVAVTLMALALSALIFAVRAA